MERTNDLLLNFMGVSSIYMQPLKLTYIGISTDALKLGSLLFWGTSTEPCDKSIFTYQIN